MKGKNITVWFSCGVASAIAAKRVLEIYGQDNHIRVVNNPILEEDEDNKRFLRDCERWLGVEIEEAVNSKYPNHSCVEVWDKRKYMSGISGAPCTGELKKKARQEWEKNNNSDYIVLGFTLEEKKRHENFILTERSNVIPVLIDCEISKADCFREILSAGIELPKIYKRGYPNANCIGCVKATSPTYWNLVRWQDKAVFDARAEQSRRLGVRLARYKGERVFLDELPSDAKGRPIKNLNFECGIFCEENK